MAETESITVAEVSDGPCGNGRPGTPVELPVVELLTGRGFITGKSGSGKSNTASVIAENLLDNGFGMLIVDIDGEYYGLKEEYEILHAGADDECDIQVTVEHAEKIASLALEQNVPIILDVSSFLDEDEAAELLTEVSKQLFAKAKKLKQPFLMLVEEVHEYIPEKGSVGECGKMLIKIGKRGRKHGLGIVGISQRPADVKKDFITQCDWLVWHRLTWNNDTKVVKRITDREHAEAVEDLDDGEGFMMTDWSETIRRVQFHRKKTFDAGATPGLDDFERPDLKSVSEDLVSELETISEEKQATETRIEELREELDRKNSRIAELEAELQDARDLQRMAEQFTQALVEHVEGANPGRTEQERMQQRRAAKEGPGAQAGLDGSDAWTPDPESLSADGDEPDDYEPAQTEQVRDEDDQYETTAMTWPGGDDGGTAPLADNETGRGDEGDREGADDAQTNGDAGGESGDGLFGMAGGGGFGANGDGGGDGRPDDADESDFGSAADESDFGSTADESDFGSTADTPSRADDAEDGAESDDSSARETITRGFDDIEDNPLGDRATNAFESGSADGLNVTTEDAGEFVRHLRGEIESLDARTRQMLRYYRDHGPGTPMDALFSAGGSDDRTEAYARNRRLRVRGLVEHVGRGRYDYRLPALLREHTGHQQVDPYVERLEQRLDFGGRDAGIEGSAD